ncbi:MAG: hypothetical protein PF445_10830 [Melioribacteraceae bacterium]|jgi:hypothetical protein|nr:hypothetical protein [Melioribacteraceae bacterium]
MVNTNEKKISYGKYIITWVALILIAVLQVVLSGITIGSNTQFFILLLSSVAVFAIISVYMNENSNKILTPIFVGIVVLELLIVTFI